MVTVGLTIWLPPLGCRVYELPSVPLIVTAVALVAATVKVDDLPEVMEVGLAVMVTVAAGAVTVTVALAVVLPSAPVAVAVYVVVAAGLTTCVPPPGCSV